MPGAGRLGVGRHDPAKDALGLDAVDPDPRPVAKHQRVADAHRPVPDAQRLARKLDPPAQRERERGSRRLVGAAHGGDRGANPVLDRCWRFGTRFRDHRRRCGARCRSDGRTGNEECCYGQCAGSRTWCIDWHGLFAPNRRRWFRVAASGRWMGLYPAFPTRHSSPIRAAGRSSAGNRRGRCDT